MLALAFFSSIFCSVLWFIYSVSTINESLGAMSFSSVGISDMAMYLSVIFVPILVLWLIFGFVLGYVNSRSYNKNLFTLFKQLKKNQDYTDLIARILLEAEQQIKDNFVINKFDLFIADMNELIAEIVYRSNIASGEQIERLWKKVQNGGKWAFGKVIVEVNSNQPNFQMRIFEKSQNDTVLAGTILEFSARYLTFVNLLEKHDKSRVFLNMVETGVFGKVFSVFAPLADEIKKSRSVGMTKNEEPKPRHVFEPKLDIEIESPKKVFATKISKLKNPFKKKASDAERYEDFEEEVTQEKDTLSIALERSFGAGISQNDDDNDSKEPKLEPKIAHEEIEEEGSFDIILEGKDLDEKIEFVNTKKTLNSLKKEWELMKKSDEDEALEPKAKSVKTTVVKEVRLEKTDDEEKDESISYPFSGWVDEDNYTK